MSDLMEIGGTVDLFVTPDVPELADRVRAASGAFAPAECARFRSRAESVGFAAATVRTAGGPELRTDVRDNARADWRDPALADALCARLRPILPPEVDGGALAGLDPDLRCYRYAPGQRFKRHKDGVARPADGVESRYSLLIFLNEPAGGGETVFYSDEKVAGRRPEVWRFRPRTGSALLFRHELWHEGAAVTAGEKLVLRTDVLYRFPGGSGAPPPVRFRYAVRMAPALADPPTVRPPGPETAPQTAAPVRNAVRRSVRRARPAPGLTLADLHERFGPLPAGRVLTDPAPGTATHEDWERANRRGDGLYELIDGTLIRKAVSDLSSWLGGRMFFLVTQFVNDHGLGYTHPADGFFNLPDGLRAPDASFTRLADRPGGLQARGYSDVPPALVVEALSPGNTRREMELKRRIYFAAGVELVWEADPLSQTVVVWTAPDAYQELSAEAGDTLTGGSVLPGFEVALNDLFAPPGGATSDS